MKYNRFLTVALLLAILVMGSIAPIAAWRRKKLRLRLRRRTPPARPPRSSSRIWGYRDGADRCGVPEATDGTVTKSYLGSPFRLARAINLDQRYSFGRPGVSPFLGSVIASCLEPLGRSSTCAHRYRAIL